MAKENSQIVLIIPNTTHRKPVIFSIVISENTAIPIAQVTVPGNSPACQEFSSKICNKYCPLGIGGHMPACWSKFTSVYCIPVIQSAISVFVSSGIIMIPAISRSRHINPGNAICYKWYRRSIIIFSGFQVLNHPHLGPNRYAVIQITINVGCCTRNWSRIAISIFGTA